MARASSGPSPEQPRAARGARAADAPPVERYGELEIARHVKDDGRALILYSHRRERPIAESSQ